MAVIYGYLRVCRRSDSSRGMSLNAQKKMVLKMISSIAMDSELDEFRHRQLIFKTERGAVSHWPYWRVLSRLFELAAEDGAEATIIIPTLDGVQWNSMFLEMLLHAEVSIYVRSGWRKRDARDYWELGDHEAEDQEDFKKIIERVLYREARLSSTTKLGLKAAKEAGTLLGAQNPNAHKFTDAERSKGSRRSAANRSARRAAKMAKRKAKLAANDRHEKAVLDKIWELHERGESLRFIARQLNEVQKARTPSGGKYNLMLISRILIRERKRREQESSSAAPLTDTSAAPLTDTSN